MVDVVVEGNFDREGCIYGHDLYVKVGWVVHKSDELFSATSRGR